MSEDDMDFVNFENKISLNSNNAQALFTSVIRYHQDKSGNNLPIMKPEVDLHQEIKKEIMSRFTK